MTDGYLKFHHWRILWSSYRKLALSGIWTHEYWILFRHSNRLSYQATSSTSTQSQFCTTTPFSSFVQCHISFRLFASVSHHVYFNRNFLYIYIYIYCEKISICLETHLNYQYPTTFLYLWYEIFCGFSHFL